MGELALILELLVMFNHIRTPFLDETGFIPSKRYVSQHEIAEYAEMLADHFDIRKHIKFSYEVTELKYLKKVTG